MTTPLDVPVLARGTHLTPNHGACLMEFVSILAGEAFSDSPRCTHPALATLARVVNDTVSDGARPALLQFAPLLAGADSPTAHTAAIVEASLQSAMSALPDSGRLARHHRRARRRAAAVVARNATSPHLVRWWHRLTDLLYLRGPAQHAVAALVTATDKLEVGDRDALLTGCLTTALSSCAATTDTATSCNERTTATAVPA
jgi:hypothetical protein